MFPTEGVPVLVDDTAALFDWLDPVSIPSLTLLDLDTMEVVILDNTDGVASFLAGAFD